MINSLADGDILKWQSVLNLPYDQVFLKQYLNKTEFAYREKYNELYALKHNRP
jgi:hypothetical protein